MFNRLLCHLYPFFVIFFSMLLAGCEYEKNSNESPAPITRWYSEKQVALGEKVYRDNCIACHLENASGTKNWKKSLDDGSYPPPPLNGSAHAWHHSIDVLLNVIQEGGTQYGGKMPAFKNRLAEHEQLAVIAYFQHFWTDDIYSRWQKITE